MTINLNHIAEIADLARAHGVRVILSPSGWPVTATATGDADAVQAFMAALERWAEEHA